MLKIVTFVTKDDFMYKSLTNCPIFKGIDADRLEILFKDVHHFTKKYEPGEMIHLAGEECRYLLCLMEGSVIGEMVDINGKVIKIEDIIAPRVLAAAFLFGKDNKFPVNIMINKKTSLLYIPREEFLKLMRVEQKILINYLNAISSRAQFLSDKIRFLSFKTIRGKLAHYIFKLSRRTMTLLSFQHPNRLWLNYLGLLDQRWQGLWVSSRRRIFSK